MEGLYRHESQAICFLKPGFLIAYKAARAVSLWSMWRLWHQGNDAVSLRYWIGEKVALHYCIIPSKALEMLWRQKEPWQKHVCVFLFLCTPSFQRIRKTRKVKYKGFHPWPYKRPNIGWGKELGYVRFPTPQWSEKLPSYSKTWKIWGIKRNSNDPNI